MQATRHTSPLQLGVDPDHSSTGPIMSGTRRASRTSMACTTCRQVKLRCDAQERFPAPCSRCEKQVKACIFDPRFKRQVVRGALEKAIEEKEELERLIYSYKNSSTAISASSTITFQSQETNSAENAVPHTPLTTDSRVPATTTLTYELSGVTLDSHIANELLEHFHQHYSDHVPFIEIEQSADAVYQASDILFWALVLVSARNHPLFNRQFPQLKSAFHGLLSEYIVRAIRCTYTVQALLLLCTWPMPVASQGDDPSWNYCSLAVSAVQQIGIHEPVHIEGKRSAQSVPYLKAWLGCFVVSTELATDYGFPPPMSLVAGRLPIVKSHIESHFPDEFWARCELQQHSIRVFTTLHGISSSNQLQMPLLGLLERDLDSLGANIKARVSQRYHIDFLAAKLRLCSIPSLTLSSKEVEKTLNTQEWAAWYRGFHAAIQLITIYTSLRLCSPQPPADELLPYKLQEREAETVHYPKHFFRVLCISGMYLAKFLAVGRDIQPQERTLARNKIKEVYETFLAWSKEELDEPFRTARMIRLLSRHAEDKISSEYFSNDSGDPSATIVDDSLRIAKKIRERTAATPATTVNSAGHHRLPRPDVVLSDWNDWLPSTYDDLFAFLTSPSNNNFDEPWI